MNRLALGTAQFGLRYGVANDTGQVSADAAAMILSRAAAASMDTLDTAVVYGNSEVCLGSVGVHSWKVVTKLPGLPESDIDVGEWVRSSARASLERLGMSQLEAVLLHRPADLLGERGEALRAAMDALRAEGIARAVGISIYDPGELDAIWPAWQPDLVQAPFNVFDRRLERSGWLAKLAASGVRVHVRSVFLQGVLLMPEMRRPVWFARWRTLIGRWEQWCVENRVSPLAAALSFVIARTQAQRLVIGVDSTAQLDEILAACACHVPVIPNELSCEDRELLEPSRWKLT